MALLTSALLSVPADRAFSLLDWSSPSAALLARTAVVALDTFFGPSSGYSVFTRTVLPPSPTRFKPADGIRMLDVDAFAVRTRDVPAIAFSSGACEARRVLARVLRA